MYPGYGPVHGFEVDVPATNGLRLVRVTALNVGAGASVVLGVRQLQVGGNPFGNFEDVVVAYGRVAVAGWAIDPDTAAATDVHVYIDGSLALVGTANQVRTDVADAFPLYGPNHGFSISTPIARGRHEVCVFAINQGPGTENVLIGCRVVTVLVVLLALVVALLAVLVVGLLRSHAEILRRLHELGAGIYDDEDGTTVTSPASTTGGVRSPVELRTRPGVPEPRSAEGLVATDAHDIAGVTPMGSATMAGVVGTGHTTLLAFWRAFGDGEGTRLPGRDTRLVIVTKGTEAESSSAVALLAPAGVTTIMSTEAYDEYSVPANPYFILVDGPTGRVLGEGAAASWSQVSTLLGQAAADAGLALDGSPLTRSAPAGRMSGPERAARADDDLLAAGIGPGHPSLYPDHLVGGDDAALPQTDPVPGSPADQGRAS